MKKAKFERPSIRRSAKTSSLKRIPAPDVAFPAAWTWLMDEAIPAWVKKNYSPRESWKDKPFGPEDARFFFKGIEELSELFTEERPQNQRGMPMYFSHPKFRSAYLLYFLPLQASKFITVFQLHEKAVQAALDHGRKQSVLRVADLGAGPGTASIALLLTLLHLKIRDIPKIEFEWFDLNRSTMEDGKAIMEHISSHFPSLRDRVSVKTRTSSWWDAAKEMSPNTSLVLLGHVLNESSGPNSQHESRAWSDLWTTLFRKTSGAGILTIEPAARRPSQLLSQLRDRLFEGSLIEKIPASLWGPCLHAGICPLADGRDWCHFSVPARIPGQWFTKFSEGLSSERLWVKFSYLWLASSDYPAATATLKQRRVISDPMGAAGEILICEPEQTGRLKAGRDSGIWRGDLILKP